MWSKSGSEMILHDNWAVNAFHCDSCASCLGDTASREMISKLQTLTFISSIFLWQLNGRTALKTGPSATMTSSRPYRLTECHIQIYRQTPAATRLARKEISIWQTPGKYSNSKLVSYYHCFEHASESLRAWDGATSRDDVIPISVQ